MSLRSHARGVLIVLALCAAGVGAAVAFDHAAYAAGHDDTDRSMLFTNANDTATTELVRVPEDESKPIEINVPSGQHRAIVVNGKPLSIDDPDGAAEQLWDYARSGRGRLTLGPIIVLLVYLMRSKRGLGRFAWFQSPVGGWTLGFGTTALFYGGTAFAAGASLTFNMLCDAVVNAFAASGKWEALRDAITGMKQRKAPVVAGVTALLVLTAGITFASVATGCTAFKSSPTAQKIIDCATAGVERAKIDALTTALRVMVDGEKPSWTDIYDRAKNEGRVIGGCALAVVVQEFMSARRATPTDQSWNAHTVLEEFRHNVAGGATFRTAAGDL